MELFKALALVALVITTLNNCGTQENMQTSSVENLKAAMDSDFRLLKQQDYEIINEEFRSLSLRISSEHMVKELQEVPDLNLIFEMDGVQLLAKGNFVFSSTMPKHCDYFFPMDENNKIITNDNIINLKKTNN